MYTLANRNRISNDFFALPRALSQLLDGRVEEEGARILPLVDVTENGKEIRLIAEVPGISREDLNVAVDKNVLTITGERKATWDQTDGAYYRVERNFGKFSRSFTLPVRVEADKIQASYRDGLLELVLPKAEEVQPKRIEIKTA